MNNEIQDYLRDSENLEEFLSQADRAIASDFYFKTGKEPMSDDIKDTAEELWDEYVNSTLPF